MDLRVRQADLSDARDTAAIVAILDSYAFGVVGGNQRLPPDVRERLIPALRQLPTTLVLLAFLDDDWKEAEIAACRAVGSIPIFKTAPTMISVVPVDRAR